MSEFHTKVVDVVRSIPKGKVMTYGEVAAAAGNPKAARAVGNMMSSNQDETVPCHRVVKSDGSIGAYNCLRGPEKLELLEEEGVQILYGKVVV